MKTYKIISAVLVLTVVMFIIFNYAPSLIQLSGLENERQILLQLIGKQKEIEQILSRENSGLKVKLASAEELIRHSQRESQEVQKPEVQKPVVEPKKKTKENRGFLFRKKKPI